MKIQLKGIVKAVTPVTSKTGPDGKTNRFQSLIVLVPGYVDQFGDKKSQDEDWEFQLINDNIGKHNLDPMNLLNQKVTVSGYLNSRKYTSSGEEKYALSLRLASVERFNN